MINGPTHATESGQSAVEHAARYEALRASAIERPVPAARDGLVVLLRQGVAAWMDAWSRLPAPPPRPTQDEGQLLSPLPDGTSAEVVRILAAMALGHIQEAHA